MKSNEDLSVSVVVPFYNRSRFLKRLLDSVAAQTLPADKVYIIDNGSSLEETLNAWHIIKAHSLVDKCIFTSSIGRGNANFARNLGYELAKTKYVAFLDSDDWWDKDHLSESVKILSRSFKAAIYSSAKIHTEKSIVFGKSINVNVFKDPFSLIMSPEGYIAQTSSYIINKHRLKNSIYWDETLKRHQDYDFFATVFYESIGWDFCPHVHVNIDRNNGGTKKEDIDYSSLVIFYEKWHDKIPLNIKKNYLIYMLYRTYKDGSNDEYKKYYYNQIKLNNFFNDWKYRFKSKKLTVISYNKVLYTLELVGLKERVKALLNTFPFTS